MRRFLPVLYFGAGAGLLGAALFVGVGILTGHSIGLLAAIVGWLCGAGVRYGAQEQVGKGLSLLAALFAWLCLAAAYASVHGHFLEDEAEALLRLENSADLSVEMVVPVQGQALDRAKYQAHVDSIEAERQATLAAAPWPLRAFADWQSGEGMRRIRGAATLLFCFPFYLFKENPRSLAFFALALCTAALASAQKLKFPSWMD